MPVIVSLSHFVNFSEVAHLKKVFFQLIHLPYLLFLYFFLYRGGLLSSGDMVLKKLICIAYGSAGREPV